MSALVLAALAALGPAATWGEIEQVAAALNASGDPEALGVFEAADWTVHGRQGSRAGWARLNAVAEQAGAGGFTALDLCCEVRNPGALRRTERWVDRQGEIMDGQHHHPNLWAALLADAGEEE